MVVVLAAVVVMEIVGIVVLAAGAVLVRSVFAQSLIKKSSVSVV
jgi:hypothetical protein